MTYKDPDKQREYQRNWMARRRSSWLEANGPCVKCGSWDNLEVDHVDPSAKTMHSSAIWSRAKSVQEKELAKCQVLCYSCHKRKSSLDISRAVRGEGNGASVFSEDDILEIRASSKPATELASCYGVHVRTIYKIKNLERWGHV